MYYELEITAEDATVTILFFEGPEIWLGYGGCFDSYELQFGTTVSTRARTIDLRGNASNWTDSEETLADDPTATPVVSACSSTGIVPLGIPALFVGLLGLRRRPVGSR